MPLVALAKHDLEPNHRIAAFQDAAATICRLEILQADVATFQSSKELAVPPDVVIAKTVHFSCLTLRPKAMAAEEADNVLIYIPRYADFRCNGAAAGTSFAQPRSTSIQLTYPERQNFRTITPGFDIYPAPAMLPPGSGRPRQVVATHGRFTASMAHIHRQYVGFFEQAHGEKAFAREDALVLDSALLAAGRWRSGVQATRVNGSASAEDGDCLAARRRRTPSSRCR